MRFGRSLILLTALTGVALMAALPATAARTSYRYDASQRVVNACVLGVPGQTVGGHPNPYIFEGMRRSDLKPDDWVFENPLAPATIVEGDVASDFVVKGKRAYWYVQLTDESAPQLVGMDLIYISALDLDLTPRQQAGLTAAVEAGAVLWIDAAIDRNAGGDPVDWTTVTNFPWDFLIDYDATDTYMLDPVDSGHEILREPHALTRSAITRLGDRPDRDEYDQWQSTQPNSTLTEGLYFDSIGPEFRTVIENIGYDNAGNEQGRAPWAIFADYGSGSVLVTAGGVGRDVVEWIVEREAGDIDWRPSPNFLQAPDVKLALNIIQWNDRWQQARRTPRASAASVARAPFPLDIKWQYPDSTEDAAANNIGPVVSTPVHSRNIVYALSTPSSETGAPASLMAFDMTPEEDRDGDNMPDDGAVTDYSLGAPYDMLWRIDLDEDMTPHYASPTITSWVDPGNNLGNTDDDVVHPQTVLISYVDVSTGEAWVDCYDGSVTGAGALLWRRQIEAFAPTAEVIAISTPIVHSGYVYVLTSEYDLTLAGPNHVNSTYSRAHCFELDYAWEDTDPWPTDASCWVSPSTLVTLDGIGTDRTATEPPKSLPPVHDPRWVAAENTMYPGGRTPLPPAPGAMPVVHASGTAADGAPVDAVLTFGTPVSFEWDDPDLEIDNSVGGSQYALMPTPFREDDESPAKPGLGSADLPWGIALNHDYFVMRMNQDITSWADTTLQIDPSRSVDQESWDAAEPRYLRHSPAAAREAAIEAVMEGANPLDTQLGVAVDVDYNTLPETEAHRLPGAVRWRRALKTGERIYQPAAMGADEVAVTAGRPIQYQYLSPPPNPPAGSGSVSKLDASSGAVRWSYDPIISIPDDPAAGGLTTSTTAAAFDDETIIAGASSVDYANQLTVSSIIGLKRQIDMQVDLVGGADGEYPAAVYMIWPDGQVHELAPSSYNVDPWMGRLMFPGASASDVLDIDGFSVGPAYGRVLRVEWANDPPEDHIAPDIERFHHTPGFVRLRFRPYDPNTVNITRPDGTVVNGAAPLHAPVAFNGRNAVLDGWVDLRGATDADGAPVEPGDELRISYEGWSERDLAWVTVPNPGGNIGVERHQTAVAFGPSLSSPAVAGDTVHLGTQGLDTDLEGTFEPAAPNPERRRTLLSLIWNRATGFVRSSLSEPAVGQPGIGGVPVVSGAPSVAEDNVFVGSRMMDTADNPDTAYGYVSAMTPWRVLLCDSNRIVETTGSQPGWVCTGTSSPQRTQSFIGEDLQRPFSRPAKATRLQTGNILVVDSGNHRVVEIDRAGRIIWPLDLYGYEYYTSPDNDNLRLSRPADAHRYYELEQGPITGRYFGVLHTIIADTGNARVIDIETRFYNPDTEVQDGRQRHTVNVLTPTYVRTATTDRGFDRVRYTSAAPITDPRNGNVGGYLCAASNLNQLLVVNAGNRVVNPFASVATAGGTAGSTWAHWAWLYDSDPADGDNVSNEPLQFENIKHVDLQRIGDTIHLSVTATRYLGRYGADLHALASEGAGVFEFRIDVGSANPADWELDQMGTGTAWPTADPHWFFTRPDYVGRPMTTISTAARDYDKRWYPVCSQRLSGDTVLITNSLSQIESATAENIGDREAVLGSHIFEVRTDDGADAIPTNDVHSIDAERSVPQPGEMWSDPFTQPTYAEVK